MHVCNSWSHSIKRFQHFWKCIWWGHLHTCNFPVTYGVCVGWPGSRYLVHIHDILVLGQNFNKHLHNLRKVFDQLQEADLWLKPTKCHLTCREVEYLDYIVSDPWNIEAVQTFPVPNNLMCLCSFLGLASYYQRFIQNFSSLLTHFMPLLILLLAKRPLTDWRWCWPMHLSWCRGSAAASGCG